MITADFLINKSDKLYVEKNLQAVLTNEPITIIEPVNIREPVLKLSKDIGSLSFNYLYIPAFGRYYFLTEPPTWREGFYEAHFHSDVLMSFRISFYKKEAIMARNVRNYNLYLSDDRMKIFNYPYFQTLNMKCVSGSGFDMKTNNICLALVGSVDGGE